MKIFLFSHKNCPNCGASGRLVKGLHGVRHCSTCQAIYSEFGLLFDGEKQEELELS